MIEQKDPKKHYDDSQLEEKSSLKTNLCDRRPKIQNALDLQLDIGTNN